MSTSFKSWPTGCMQSGLKVGKVRYSGTYQDFFLAGAGGLSEGVRAPRIEAESRGDKCIGCGGRTIGEAGWFGGGKKNDEGSQQRECQARAERNRRYGWMALLSTSWKKSPLRNSSACVGVQTHAHRCGDARASLHTR
eukprot:6192902-Pleurochrysis_carterae.AAC.1